MRISVTPEGRENIFIPYSDSLIAWIENQNFKHIHNFIPTGHALLGADHDTESVIRDIRAAERLAITIGSAWNRNMKHALAILRNNELQIYDIGELTDSDLEKQELPNTDINVVSIR